MNWGLGIGDWGLGVWGFGGWGGGPKPKAPHHHPHTPIPNPHGK